MQIQVSTLALGIDIGGTKIRLGLITPSGDLLAFASAQTPRGGNVADTLRIVVRLSSDLERRAETQAEAVGVAVAGIRDKEGIRLERAANLPSLEGIDIVELLSGALGRPVRIETDVNAAAYAQWRAISPRVARFVYLSLGTGVGGAVIVDGRLVRHTNHGAGHLGFLIVDTRPGAPCDNLGLRGTLSAFVRGQALEREWAGSSARQEVSRALAVGLHQIAVLYAPQVIAVGGGALERYPDVLERAARHVAHMPSLLPRRRPQVMHAPLTADHAGVVGAALLAAAY